MIRAWPYQLATCRRESPLADCSCRRRSPERCPSNCSTTPHSPSRAARKIGPSGAPAPGKPAPPKAPAPTIMPGTTPGTCCCASGLEWKYWLTTSMSRGSSETILASSSMSGSPAASPWPDACPPAETSRHTARTSSRRASCVRRTCASGGASPPGKGPPCNRARGNTTLPLGVWSVTVAPGKPPGCSCICGSSAGSRVCTVSCGSGSQGGRGCNPCASRHARICARMAWFGRSTLSGSACPVFGEVPCSSSHLAMAARS
mmetsp:Transcript_124528/g.387738  ORF Transcript_124528/g.387738 Transcript_124528/m.387738 type:complete len:260 (-) Transcript_124528:143-922(-)